MSCLPKGILTLGLLGICLSSCPLQAITFSDWQNTVFSPAELTNSAISGTNANITGDGISNLLKYAFGIDPHTPSVSPISLSLSSSGPTLTFPELDAATDLLYHLAESPDLQHWITPNNPTISYLSDDGTLSTVSLSDPNAPVSSARWFDSLRVVQSPDGSEPLLAPNNLTATLNTPYTIQLAWNDNSAIEEGYRIERNNGTNGTWQQIASTGPDINTFIDQQIVGSTAYSYRVRAFQGASNSDYSSQTGLISPSTAPQMPAWWQAYYFPSYDILSGTNLAPSGSGLNLLQSYQQGLNPQGTGITILSGNNQTGSPGGLVPQPLIVSVTDISNNPIVNTPVSFTVGQGGGTLLASSVGTNASTLTLQTDVIGQARVYFQLASTPNTTSTITCVAPSQPYALSIALTESSDDGTGSYGSPFDASNVAANYNDDGSVDVSWVNNADPADTNTTVIQYQDASGTWQTLTSVPAGATSIHIPAQ